MGAVRTAEAVGENQENWEIHEVELHPLGSGSGGSRAIPTRLTVGMHMLVQRRDSLHQPRL